MNKYLSLILCTIFLIRTDAAVLDITGWNQEGVGGRNEKVKITGVATGEVPFFTNTAGQVQSRKIITTDINDTTSIGRSLMTAADQAAVQAIVGVAGPSIPGIRIPYGNGSGSLTSELTFSYDASNDRMSVGKITLGSAVRLESGGVNVFSLIGNGSSENITIDLGTADQATIASTTGVNKLILDGVDLEVPAEVYGPDWDNDNSVPTKNDVYDKIQNVIAGSGFGLTEGQIGYGNVGDTLTGEAGFNYDPADNVMNVQKILAPEYITTGIMNLLETSGSGANYVSVLAGSDYTTNRTLTIFGPDNDVELTIPSTGGMTLAGSNHLNAWGDGIKQTFNPNGTNAGINVGSHASDPSSPEEGDIWQNSSTGEVKVYANGTNVIIRNATVSIGAWPTPNTDNPFAITWTEGHDAVLYQGITGELDLPPVADYASRKLTVVSTGSFTITVDPDGTNQIIVDGASLGSGTADVLTASAGQSWEYSSDGYRWRRESTGGASLTNTYVGYGAGGVLSGEAAFTYDATTNTLTAGAMTAGNVTASTVLNIGGDFQIDGSLADNLIITNDNTGDDLAIDMDTENVVRIWSGTGVADVQFDSINVTVPTEAYDATGWNGDNSVPTKDAVRDKFESLSGSGYTTGSFTGTATYVATNPGTVFSGAMSADATLTLTISAGQSAIFDLDVTGSTRTLTFGASYRVGYSGGTITTLALPVGRQKVIFYQNSTNLIVADSVASDVDLTADVTGTLPAANGGTGITSLGAGIATFLGTPTAANLMAATTIPVTIGIAASDETTAITTGTGKATFILPHAMTLTAVRASVTTAPTGAVITIDINEDPDAEGGTASASVLGTKLTIDAGERRSTTAATAATITDTALADGAEITIDFDTVGSGTAGAGVKVWLIGTR